jgi:antibiotic biosynthesis monooxygenase (ABM) superfamily enzyme
MIHLDDLPVTVIREIRVRPGLEEMFEEGMSRLIAEATRQPGHLGATVIRPERPGAPHRFVYKFAQRSQLEAWHDSEARARLLAPIESAIASDRYEAYPGLETWFELPGAPTPPRWKTTLMSWGAIYVVVVIVSYAMQALEFAAPIPVRALVLTGIVVPLVAYLLAPWLGRALHGWLYADMRARGPKRVRA